MWFDYVCPWAYLGRDRTRIMRDLGLTVTLRTYELHPEIPREGVPVRPGGRLDRVLDHIGAECARDGIPFTKPTMSRSSRLALETVEVVRAGWPDAFAAADEAISHASWVDGLDIARWEVLAPIVEAAGAPPEEVFDRVADGEGTAALAASMAEARERGVTATPAWWVDDALLIPGAQPREAIERWVTRLLARAGDAPA